MKTKIGAAIIALLFLMSCGSADSSKDQKDLAAAEAAKSDIKFIIKASNMQYVSVTANNTLVANQPNPTKATVFEKVDLGNGKCALKASNGKFVSNDKSKNSQLTADRDQHNDWETFEIISLDQSTANIKTSDGKYVSDEQSAGDIIVGNRDHAGDWERFTLEQQ